MRRDRETFSWRVTACRLASAGLAAGALAWSSPALAQAAPSVNAPSGADAPPPAALPRRPPATPPRTKLEWSYPTFGTGEYVATGIFGALAIGGLAIPTATARWTGDNGLDRGVRDVLRLDARGARKTADDISDLTLTASLNYVLFDSLVVAWLGYDKGSVAYQMTAIDFETLAFTNAVTSVVKGAAARERPYAAECRTNEAAAGSDDCDPSALNRSFFSGHTSTTFAAASLTCMHHAHLPLYGGGAGDVVACAGAYSVAATTGVLRIMSDNHNTTDVVVGAAFGTLAGLGIPWALHYRTFEPSPGAAPAKPRSANVHFVPGPMSGFVIGEF